MCCTSMVERHAVLWDIKQGCAVLFKDAMLNQMQHSGLSNMHTAMFEAVICNAKRRMRHGRDGRLGQRRKRHGRLGLWDASLATMPPEQSNKYPHRVAFAKPHQYQQMVFRGNPLQHRNVQGGKT